MTLRVYTHRPFGRTHNTAGFIRHNLFYTISVPPRPHDEMRQLLRNTYYIASSWWSYEHAHEIHHTIIAPSRWSYHHTRSAARAERSTVKERMKLGYFPTVSHVFPNFTMPKCNAEPRDHPVHPQGRVPLKRLTRDNRFPLYIQIMGRSSGKFTAAQERIHLLAPALPTSFHYISTPQAAPVSAQSNSNSKQRQTTVFVLNQAYLLLRTKRTSPGPGELHSPETTPSDELKRAGCS